MNIAVRVRTAIEQAGVPIEGVSIGDAVDKATWTVRPSSLQASAQPTIDVFDPNDPAHSAWDAQQERDRELARKVIKALAIATHKRFKAQIGTDSTTAAQWEASLRAEYDAL